MTAAEAVGATPSERLLEFCCKCVRRAMELPSTDFEELSELLKNKIKTNVEREEPVFKLLSNRIDNLQHDIVIKQRNRFQVLEEKVK